MSAPFIRSAGGKRELAPQILSLMPQPPAFDTYVEPFAGGAAVFYALWNDGRLDNKTVVLGDGDPDLIALYAAVRDDVLSLIRETDRLIAQANKASSPEDFYNEQRGLWNKGGRYRTPARHLFLRRACFNGLWRTNKAGEMNTPWKGEPPKPLDPPVLLRAMSSLTTPKAELLDWDFRRYEEDEDFFIGPRTLVYVDPPYLGDAEDFTSYLPSGWNKEDLDHLLRLCREWTIRGAHVVLSHSDTSTMRDALRANWPSVSLTETTARRAINSDAEGRGPVGELIVVGTVDTSPVMLRSVPRVEDARSE
ncbi:methylase-like protein [Virus Rctr197k]|nr:methylase-like protein [Virus Rctr197k]